MSNVIRATTPTIKYTFKVVSVSDITKAYLTIKKGEVTIEKDLSDAIVGEKYLAWTLTQQETLSIAAGNAQMELNWLTQGGTRGASKRVNVTFDPNLKEEVI